MHTGECLRSITNHTQGVSSVAYHPNGLRLASNSGYYDRVIHLWDVPTGSRFRTLEGHERRVESLVFSPDGSMLASGGGWDGTTRLWDGRTGKSLRTLREWGKWDDVDSVAFSPDGRKIATAGHNAVCVWNVGTGELLESLTGHLGYVSSVAFSPDGAMLASGGGWKGTTVRLWDVRAAKATHALVGHKDSVTSVAFSPDGLTLASGSSDYTIRMWNPNTGERLRTIEGHTSRVTSIAFSPDGYMLASGSWDGTIRLWDVRTGENLQTLFGHVWGADSVAFSPDGLTLASGSPDGTILLWDLTRPTTWGDIRRVADTDGMSQLMVLSPSAAPVNPPETVLLPNYPNPFNPETWIPYQLETPADVVLTIYDMSGQRVRTIVVGHQPAGSYLSRGRAAYWNCRNQQGEPVASGVYFCTLTAGDFSAKRKMLIRK